MKLKRLVCAIVFFWWLPTWGGGVGGFDGGSASIKSGRGPVLFQEYSMLVNPYFNKSLCLTSDDYYRADVTLVEAKTKSNQSLKHYRDTVFQSRVSLKSVCLNKNRSGTCLESEWRKYVQPRTRIIDVQNGKGEVLERVQLRIPDCQ